MPDVVVLGSLNMDLVVKTERMPRPGETVRGEAFTTVPGGKGANQAAAAARLGATVEMVGCVGGDAFGPALRENLRAQGVGVSHVRVEEGAATGTAMIIVDGAGENSIVVAAGANGRVSAKDVAAARPLLEAARYLVVQWEIPLDVVAVAMRAAREVGLPVIVNAAPAHAAEEGLLEGAAYAVVNEHEAEALTGIAVPDPDSAERAGRALLGMGVGAAIVTLGPRGALLVAPSCVAHVPARRVRVVDTTAAGDAFVGGLAAALLRGMDDPDAVRYATLAGTLATTVLGAQTSLPAAEAVERLWQEATPERR